jgi:CRP/FNR family nitrogen fixation transcriptional regulator
MRLSTATSPNPEFPAAVVLRGPGYMPRDAVRSRPCGSTRVLARGEELFAEGDDAEHFYKVVTGTIRTYKLLSDGRRQIDAFHLPGDMFGLEAGPEHRFSAEAVDGANVVAFRRSRLVELRQADPGFDDEVMASMIRNLERAQDHMLLLGRKTAQEKIATFLLDLARRLRKDRQFDLPMQRSDIADHLGLTIETVSRTLTQLSRDGLIALVAASRSIVLADRAGLQRLEG